MRYKHISKDERNELSILLKKGYSFRQIAHALRRSPSSISREVSCNKVKGRYHSSQAQAKARTRRKQSKYQGMKIRDRAWLEDYVRQALEFHWTPEQIAGRLKQISNDQVLISAKSIYKYLYSVYGQPWCQYLPSRRYYPKKRTKKKTKRELIPNRVSIEERPEVINIRKRFGDFEADSLGRIKTDTEALIGTTERQSRCIFLKKVGRLKYAMDGFKQLLNPHHKIVQSVTFDNGVENKRHEELKVSTYFCHAYSAWEKGTMENAFQRLRRFIPKKSSLKDYTDQDIFAIMEIMNNTPRKCLGYCTPKEVFNKLKCCT